MRLEFKFFPSNNLFLNSTIKSATAYKTNDIVAQKLLSKIYHKHYPVHVFLFQTEPTNITIRRQTKSPLLKRGRNVVKTLHCKQLIYIVYHVIKLWVAKYEYLQFYLSIFCIKKFLNFSYLSWPKAKMQFFMVWKHKKKSKSFLYNYYSCVSMLMVFSFNYSTEKKKCSNCKFQICVIAESYISFHKYYYPADNMP